MKQLNYIREISTTADTKIFDYAKEKDALVFLLQSFSLQVFTYFCYLANYVSSYLEKPFFPALSKRIRCVSIKRRFYNWKMDFETE